jgi:hypothetical protein
MNRWIGRVSVLVAVAFVACLTMPQRAPAVSIELAKKCRALALKAHPGPTPGSKATGVAKAERDYFQACLAKNGNTDNNGNPPK